MKRGRLDANSPTDAAELLRRQGLELIDLDEAISGRYQISIGELGSARLSLSYFSGFARSMADLLLAGLRVPQALELCRYRENKTSASAFVDRINDAVRHGGSLSRALREDPVNVPALLVAMVAAGERTGNLGEAFEEFARCAERTVEFRRASVAQLAYPAFLAALVLLTIVFVSFVILPKFEAMFAAGATDPPGFTQIVLAMGSTVRDYWWAGVLGGVLLAVVLSSVIAMRPGDVDRVLVGMPVIGKFVLRTAYSHFCRSLGTLLSNGVSMSNSFPIALDAVNNFAVKDDLKAVERKVRTGSSLTAALMNVSSVPDIVVTMVRMGEHSGQLGPLLTKAAELCEQETQKVQKVVLEIAGPAMILVMGAVVAGVVGSVMIGVLSLNEAVIVP